MVYLFLADGFEEVEAITPLDYFRRCNGIKIKTVGIGTREVTGAHGIKIIADILESEVNHSDMEMIILPGGMPGTLNLENNKIVQDAIRYCTTHHKFIGAICAAPSILGHMGILMGKKATCYVGFKSELIGCSYVDEAVVVYNNIITANGAGSANQFAFELLNKIAGKDIRDKVVNSILWKE